VLAGSFPRKLSSFQFFDGLIGLGTKPPPQFGQTLLRTFSTHEAQNVHSYVQMRASSELGGRVLLQCSQVGLSSSRWLLFVRLTCSSAAARGSADVGWSNLLASYSSMQQEYSCVTPAEEIASSINLVLAYK